MSFRLFNVRGRVFFSFFDLLTSLGIEKWKVCIFSFKSKLFWEICFSFNSKSKLCTTLISASLKNFLFKNVLLVNAIYFDNLPFFNSCWYEANDLKAQLKSRLVSGFFYIRTFSLKSIYKIISSYFKLINQLDLSFCKFECIFTVLDNS